MRILQKLIPTFAIVAYVAIFLGGRTLQQQCCHNSSECSYNTSSLRSLECTLNDCTSGHAHIPSSKCEGTSNPTNDNSPEDEHSDCWTCYTLSQPFNSLAEIELHADIQPVYLVYAYFEGWRLQASVHSHLIRGPPNIYLATS